MGWRVTSITSSPGLHAVTFSAGSSAPAVDSPDEGALGGVPAAGIGLSGEGALGGVPAAGIGLSGVSGISGQPPRRSR
jgi:hypothetical protein